MTFEDLETWRKARKLVNVIYQMTGDSPLARDFGLCRQIQRAAVSIMSNVAEGFERTHTAEKLQAYNIARASCGEVRSLLYVVEDNYQRSAVKARETRILASEVGSLATGLLNSTRRRLAGKATTAVVSLLAVLWVSFYFVGELFG